MEGDICFCVKNKHLDSRRLTKIHILELEKSAPLSVEFEPRLCEIFSTANGVSLSLSLSTSHGPGMTEKLLKRT